MKFLPSVTIIIGLSSSSMLTLAAAAADDSDPDPGCCTLTKRPGSKKEDYFCIDPNNAKTEYCVKAKVATARWMAQSLEWGTLSTFRADATNANGDGDVSVDGDVSPFGNTYSFADGPCGAGSGTPYFYGSDLDASFTDAAKNPSVSFTLTEASLKSSCVNRTEDLTACAISASGGGDPENPPCARVTLVGNFTLLTEGTDEYTYGKAALFERHPAMANWPTDHEWLVGKIDVDYVWTIDFYGGANVFTAKQYYHSTNGNPIEAE
mmetsp:Transcript_32653/g.36378  ORF Transcript_32653/g.36378 Transcript_32653/m.36378 type:complete len:265 (-) Transcript_32653:118-912(-)